MRVGYPRYSEVCVVRVWIRCKHAPNKGRGGCGPQLKATTWFRLGRALHPDSQLRLNFLAVLPTKPVVDGRASGCRTSETHPDDSRTDEALIALINQGDADAFESLYRRHRDWVVNLASRLVSDRDLAPDVLQETFLYVLKKFPGFHLRCQFRSFLYPAVRNLSIAARWKAARLRGSDEIELDQLEAQPGAADGNSGRARLARVLVDLSEPQREVVLLRFVDGLSLDEIADALEVPTGTIKSRLHNALTALRKGDRTREFFLE